MSKLKDALKKHKNIVQIYHVVKHAFLSFLTLISPTLNSKVLYRHTYKKPLNLKNPQTFSEKLMWLKLHTYIKSPLVIQCADKYLVREYLESCGCADILNELHGAYDRVEDIPWEDLPDQFALKWNFGCGYNLICEDKNKLNIYHAKRKLKKWRREKYHLRYSEMQYKFAPKKLICEKYLKSGAGRQSPDYKLFCFHGKAKLVIAGYDRSTDLKLVFLTPHWELVDYGIKKHWTETIPPKPESLVRMIEVAERLSQPFPFVRIDFYDVHGHAIFGEMTFTPSACLSKIFSAEGEAWFTKNLLIDAEVKVKQAKKRSV